MNENQSFYDKYFSNTRIADGHTQYLSPFHQPDFSKAKFFGLLLGPTIGLSLLQAYLRKRKRKNRKQRSSYLKELSSILASEAPYATTGVLGLPFYAGLLGGKTLYKKFNQGKPIRSALSSEFLKSLPWVGTGLLGSILAAYYLKQSGKRGPVIIKI